MRLKESGRTDDGIEVAPDTRRTVADRKNNPTTGTFHALAEGGRGDSGIDDASENPVDPQDTGTPDRATPAPFRSQPSSGPPPAAAPAVFLVRVTTLRPSMRRYSTPSII